MHHEDQNLSNALVQILNGIHGSGDLFTFDEGLHGQWSAGVLDGLFGAKLIIPSPKDFYGKRWCAYCEGVHPKGVVGIRNAEGQWIKPPVHCKNPGNHRRPDQFLLEVSANEVSKWETSPYQLFKAVAAVFETDVAIADPRSVDLFLVLDDKADARTSRRLTLHRHDLTLHYKGITTLLVDCLSFKNGALRVQLPRSDKTDESISKRERQKLHTQKRNEDLCRRFRDLRDQNSSISAHAAAKRIFKDLPAPAGKKKLSQETIRGLLRNCEE